MRFFCRNCRNQYHERSIVYIAGKRRGRGRKRRLCDADDAMIEALIKADDNLSDHEVARLFCLYRSGDEHFAGTTLIRRARLRRKVVPLVYSHRREQGVAGSPLPHLREHPRKQLHQV